MDIDKPLKATKERIQAIYKEVVIGLTAGFLSTTDVTDKNKNKKITSSKC